MEKDDKGSTMIRMGVAQSTSDRDVALRREQIMQARRLWENTASEEALGELFALFLQRVEPGSA